MIGKNRYPLKDTNKPKKKKNTNLFFRLQCEHMCILVCTRSGEGVSWWKNRIWLDSVALQVKRQ